MIKVLGKKLTKLDSSALDNGGLLGVDFNPTSGIGRNVGCIPTDVFRSNLYTNIMSYKSITSSSSDFNLLDKLVQTIELNLTSSTCTLVAPFTKNGVYGLFIKNSGKTLTVKVSLNGSNIINDELPSDCYKFYKINIGD